MMKKWLVSFALCTFALVLAGCGGFSLAADITPPPGLQPQQAPSNQAQAISSMFPLLPPDPAQGAAIYATKCLPCHGPAGMGDGPQAANLPAPPPAIGSADISRTFKPVDWFTLVTQGNLQQFMPGFQGSLSDRQRWDVVAYVLTLSTTQTGLDQGKSLYEEKCAECHGETGKGDGPKAAGLNVPDWSQQQRLAKLSSQELEAVVANGSGKMPAYANDLSQDQRWNVVDYVRSLTFASQGIPPAQQAIAQTQSATGTSETPGAAQTPSAQGAYPPPNGTPSANTTPAATSGKVTIRGKITSAGSSGVPAGLKVTLTGFEGMTQISEVSTNSAADASYEFKDVAYQSTNSFIVRVDANGYTFSSDLLQATDIHGDSAELPVTLYDTTTDASGLSTDRLHVFFDFSTQGTIQVVELFIISNPTGKLVVPAAADKPVLTFDLPDGAANLQFDSGALGDRYIKTATGFGDLAPVEPGSGQHQVLFSFEEPYDGKLALSVPIKMNTTAAVVMVPVGGVSVKSDQLQSAGTRDVQGTSYQLYAGNSLSAGSTLQINLSGNIHGNPATNGSNSNLIVGLGVFGAALIGAALWLFRQRRLAQPVREAAEEPSGAAESVESLLDAILALDDLHQTGALPDEAYRVRRAELKERVRRAMDAARE